MEFWNWHTVEQSYHALHLTKGLHKRDMPTREEIYKAYANDASESDNVGGFNHMVMEWNWLQLGKPYYNVWPKIVEPLSKFRLDSVQSDQIMFPISELCLRFAKGSGHIPIKDPDGNLRELRSILVHSDYDEDVRGVPLHKRRKGVVPYADIVGEKKTGQVIIYMSWGEMDKQFAVGVFRRFVHSPGLTVEEALNELATDVQAMDRGWEIPIETTVEVCRLVVACAMIAKNPDEMLMQPDVLADDRQKWEDTKNPALVDKAKRRGKFGWDIGREIHVSPHWRRPHPCLIPCGKDRADRKLIMRKGSLVKRDLVTKLPTGYQEDDQ